MTAQNLKEYLAIIMDMESNVYFQEELIKRLQSKAQELEIRNKSLPIPVEPKKPSKPNKDYSFLWFIPFIIICIAVIIFAHYLYSPGIRSIAVIIGFFGASSLLGVIVGFITCASDEIKSNKKSEQFYLREKNDYPAEIKAYNASMNKYETERKMLPEQIQSCNMLIQKTIETKNRTSTNLKQFYDYNVIYFKWRGFVNVSNLYDYIASGMCTSLEGPHGAYEQLMEDIRAEKVINSIESAKKQLLNALNNIYLNQSSILNELQGINRRLDNMSNDINSKIDKISYDTINSTNLLESIRTNSSVIAYQNERIQKELQYANRMNYLVGNYNGTFYNIPPT